MIMNILGGAMALGLIIAPIALIIWAAYIGVDKHENF